MSVLTYDINGKGTPIVLLHGFLENRSMWTKTIEHLSRFGKCISIDLPGHGDSIFAASIYSLSDIAEQLHKLFLELELNRFHMIGHSLGGYVAMAYAKKYPDMLQSMLMCHSTAKDDTPEKKKQRERARKAVVKFKNTYLQNSIPLLFVSERQEELQADITLMVEEAAKMSSSTINRYLLMMKMRENHTELVKEMTIPIAYLIGKQDPLLDANSLIEEAKTCRAPYFLLENAGHMGHLEDEKSFSYFITQHITSQKNGLSKR